MSVQLSEDTNKLNYKGGRNMLTRQRIQNKSVQWFSIILTILLSLMIVRVEAAEKFPEKTITVVVGYPAGSGADTDTRLIQPYFQKYLGVNVVIENIPGAGGKIGLTKAFKAPNDGYTLHCTGCCPGPILTELLEEKPEYKTLEFTFIAGWCVTDFVLVVNSETWKTMDELVQAAKSKILNCGLSGLVSASRICGESLLEATGIKEMRWVGFAGAAESLVQLAGKHIDLVITSTSSALALARAGKIRPLMMFAYEKDSVFPDVPLGKDLGYAVAPMPSWRSFQAPPRLPMEKVRILEDAVKKITKDLDFQKTMKQRGVDVFFMSHEKLTETIRDQYSLVQRFAPRVSAKEK